MCFLKGQFFNLGLKVTQIAAYLTTCYSYKLRLKFIAKCVKFFVTNALILLQQKTDITKCDNYYIMCWCNWQKINQNYLWFKNCWILNIIWIISWHSIENCCLSRLLYGSFIMLGFWKYVKNFPISVHSHIVHSDCLILLKKDFPVVLCFDMILPTLTSIPNFIS